MDRGRRTRHPAMAPLRTLYQIEPQLMLLGWANRQFGFRSNQELFDALKVAREGYDSDGRSYVAHILGGRTGCQIPTGNVARYNDNLRRRKNSPTCSSLGTLWRSTSSFAAIATTHPTYKSGLHATLDLDLFDGRFDAWRGRRERRNSCTQTFSASYFTPTHLVAPPVRHPGGARRTEGRS